MKRIKFFISIIIVEGPPAPPTFLLYSFGCTACQGPYTILDTFSIEDSVTMCPFVVTARSYRRVTISFL